MSGWRAGHTCSIALDNAYPSENLERSREKIICDSPPLSHALTLGPIARWSKGFSTSSPFQNALCIIVSCTAAVTKRPLGDLAVPPWESFRSSYDLGIWPLLTTVRADLDQLLLQARERPVLDRL
jgi:hypothetical protein